MRCVEVVAVSAAFVLLTPWALAAPRIVCEQLVKDFGALDSNTQSLEHAFVLWNRGDTDLEIRDVVSGCGCATANAGEKTLRPGSNTTIRATLSLAGRKGALKKDIRVASNDPLTPQLVLQVACDVRLAVDAEPAGMNFGSVGPSQVVSRTVNVRAASNVTFAVTSVDTSAAPSVVVETRTVEPGRTYAVTATIRPGKLPGGVAQEKIVVHTDHPAIPAVVIPVTAYKCEDVAVIPNELALLENDISKSEVRRDLYLRVQATNRWEFFDVEAIGGFKVAVERRDAGHCRVVLSDLKGLDESGNMRLAITAKCVATGAERRLELKLRRYTPKRSSVAGAPHAVSPRSVKVPVASPSPN
jgi:hypothetical protein